MTQIRPTEICDTNDGTTSPVRCSYRVQKGSDEPVMLHVTSDGKIWIGYGVEPKSFSLVGLATEGTSRCAVCGAANCW